MTGLDEDMETENENSFIGIICLLILVCEIVSISYSGIRVMFPIYVYGSYQEVLLWEEFAETEIEYFLPVYARREENREIEKRKDVFHIQKMEREQVLTLMDLENSDHKKESPDGNLLEKMKEENLAGSIKNPMEEELAKTEEIRETEELFTEKEKKNTISMEELQDYETLVKRFYTIDSITSIGPEELNAEKLSSIDLTIRQTSDQPQILIYHTHSQEGFADSVEGDESTTIIGAGERLAELLEGYGYQVIHHTGKYDVKTRDSAYSKALPEVLKMLEDNPSIEVVIDLHRDAMDEEIRLVTDLDGRPTAKFMFFNGISRTTKNGKIDYLYNKNLETNLAFSFQAKWKAEEYYPGLTRRNYINAYRYNMHVCPKTMLVELGAQNNTVEEVLNACEPLAHILHMVLSGEG